MSLLKLDESLTAALFIGQDANKLVTIIVAALAIAPIYLLPLMLVYLFFKGWRNRLNSIKIFFAVILAWQVFSNIAGKYFFEVYNFRLRPFAPSGVQEWLFERPEKAFPSDHAAALAAVTACLFFLKYPRLGWIFLTLSLVTGAARVIIGFHYIGDIVAGYLLGLAAFGILFLINPLIDMKFNKDNGNT